MKKQLLSEFFSPHTHNDFHFLSMSPQECIFSWFRLYYYDDDDVIFSLGGNKLKVLSFHATEKLVSKTSRQDFRGNYKM